MNTKRARVVALISGAALAVVAFAAPAAASDDERWLGYVGGFEVYQRCAGDEPILHVEMHSSSGNWDFRISTPDGTYVGDVTTATYAPTSVRVPAGDYIGGDSNGSLSSWQPFTVRPCPFPAATPPRPAPTVEASIIKVPDGKFRVTVDNRNVTTSVRIGITWLDSRGTNLEVFSVAPDKLVTTATWRANRGAVIKVQDRTHNELLASTRR